MSSALLLGLALGVRHAFDPDHLAAVSTFVAGTRQPWRAGWIGASWALGHGAMLLAVGVLALAINAVVPASLVRGAEAAAGGLLILLGAANLSSLFRAPRPDAAPPRALRRAGLVGLVHGLAGSGVLAIVASSSLPDPAAVLTFLLAFALGTLAAMVACSALIGAPFALLRRDRRSRRALVATAGLLSIAIGVALLTSLLGPAAPSVA